MTFPLRALWFYLLLYPENSGVMQQRSQSCHFHVTCAHERQVYDNIFQHNPSASVLEILTGTPCVPVGNSYRWKHEAVHLSCPARTLYDEVPQSSRHHLTKDKSCLIAYSSSFPDMNGSASASFLLLYNSALQDYTTQTGTNLINHPFSKQLEKCESVESISSLLHENLRRFREFRTEDGKIIKSLKCTVRVLHTLSTSTVLGEGIGLIVRPKAVIPISCP